MKTKAILFSLLLLGALACVPATAFARGVIVYHNGAQVSNIIALPDSAIIDKQHVNIGVQYNQFGIFWIPMWNYGETKYVLVNDKEDTYWEFSPEEIQAIASSMNVKIPETPTIDFWNKIGGKLIWIAVIALCVWGYSVKSKGKEEEEEEEETQSPPSDNEKTV